MGKRMECDGAGWSRMEQTASANRVEVEMGDSRHAKLSVAGELELWIGWRGC